MNSIGGGISYPGWWELRTSYIHFQVESRDQDSSARGSEQGWHEALGQTRDDQDHLPRFSPHGKIE